MSEFRESTAKGIAAGLLLIPLYTYPGDHPYTENSSTRASKVLDDPATTFAEAESALPSEKRSEDEVLKLQNSRLKAAAAIQESIQKHGIVVVEPPTSNSTESLETPGTFIATSKDAKKRIKQLGSTESCAVQFFVGGQEPEVNISVLLHGQLENFIPENAYNGKLGHAEGLIDAINGRDFDAEDPTVSEQYADYAATMIEALCVDLIRRKMSS